MCRRCVTITEYYQMVFTCHYLDLVGQFLECYNVSENSWHLSKGVSKTTKDFSKCILTSGIVVMFPGTGSDNTNCLPNAKMTATKLILIQSVKPEYVATPLNHVPLPSLAFLKSGINNCLFFGILRLPCQSSDWTLLSFASLCTVCNIAVVEMPTHVPC